MTLKEYLDKQNLSALEFAVAIDTSVVAVRRYAKGDRIPHPDIMAKITKATGGKVTPNDFYYHA